MQWILVCILIFKRRHLFKCLLLTVCLSLVHGAFTVALSDTLPPHHHSSPFQSVSIHRTGILQIPLLSRFWPWFHLQGNLASCHTRVMPTAALTGKWRLALFLVSPIQLYCSLYLLSVCVREEGALSESQPNLTKCWQLSLPETLANM